ncbi:helix-turn-helix domain-containing protein [Nitrosomonas sp.]|uniref:helix-turn-helix domain-containing protein n=1 Tax=Nitrosomonas sp. TaxID=42353 RepID=UPI003305AEF8
MEAKILTTDEAASLLKVSRVTMLSLAASGKIPCRKIGRAWRFVDIDLIRYISEHKEEHNNGEVKCHSINEKIPLSGGSKSAITEESYIKALGLQTEKRRRNTTTN